MRSRNLMLGMVVDKNGQHGQTWTSSNDCWTSDGVFFGMLLLSDIYRNVTWPPWWYYWELQNMPVCIGFPSSDDVSASCRPPTAPGCHAPDTKPQRYGYHRSRPL